MYSTRYITNYYILILLLSHAVWFVEMYLVISNNYLIGLRQLIKNQDRLNYYYVPEISLEKIMTSCFYTNLEKKIVKARIIIFNYIYSFCTHMFSVPIPTFFLGPSSQSFAENYDNVDDNGEICQNLTYLGTHFNN